MSEQENPKKVNRRSSAWLGFAHREKTDRGTLRIRIRWGKVAILLVLMGGLAWTGKSIALYYFFRNVREFEAVSFVDMILFPMNRASVRKEQGDYQIEQGREALEREDYRRAFALLRQGLARSSENTEGRILLAQLYSGWRPDLASELLIDGLEEGMSDPQYIQLMFSILLSRKDDSTVLEIAEKLEAEDLSDDILRIAKVASLQSAMLRGKFDTALEVLSEVEIRNSMDGILLGTQLYIRSGREERARDVLTKVLLAKPDGDMGAIYYQLGMLLKDLGLHQEAREVALQYVISDPLSWEPRLMLVDILDSPEMDERRDQEINSFMMQHRGSEDAMLALARLCRQHGNVPITRELYEIALEYGYNLGRFTLLLVEANIQDGSYQTAIDLCNELAQENPAWLVNEESTFHAIRSLAYFLDDDGELGQLYLREFLESRRLRTGTLLEAAKRMHENRLFAEAKQILQIAYDRDPTNESTLALLIEVEMELGAYYAISGHLKDLFALRRPPYDTISEFRTRMLSDRFLFTEDRDLLLLELEKILSEQDAMDWNIWDFQGSESS